MSTLHVLLHGYRNAMLQFICFAGINPNISVRVLHTFLPSCFMRPSSSSHPHPHLLSPPSSHPQPTTSRPQLLYPPSIATCRSYETNSLSQLPKLNPILSLSHIHRTGRPLDKPSKGKASSPRPHPDIRLHPHHPLLMQHRVCLADEAHHFVPGPFYGGDKTTLVKSIGVKCREKA